MSYTVKQLADLAGVTTRTIHYYDEIGLLHPASYGKNCYRYYDEEAMLRLQQILFFRELDFSLDMIRSTIDRPDFDLLLALEGHKRALQERIDRIYCLIDTVDKTIKHLRGEINMSKKDFYTGFDEEKQKRYEQQVRERFGDEAMAKTKDWNAYTPEEKNDILAEGYEINMGIVATMENGYNSPEVQYWIGRWYNAINTHFYACSLEIFKALGHGYNEDPEFNAFYENIHPGLAAFMEKAMTYYCKDMVEQSALDQ
jgi:DNA-binding transcriptional MerR regulator